MAISRRVWLAVAMTSVVIHGANAARAGAMLATSRADLLPNDSIDWGQPDRTRRAFQTHRQ